METVPQLPITSLLHRSFCQRAQHAAMHHLRHSVFVLDISSFLTNRFAISTFLFSHHLANIGSSTSLVTINHTLQTGIFFNPLLCSLS